MNDSFFQITPQGLVLSVKAAPRSSRSGLGPVAGGAVKVFLHAAPVDGKANDELVETLADAFGIPKRAVEVISGGTSRSKRVLLRGVTQLPPSLQK